MKQTNAIENLIANLISLVFRTCLDILPIITPIVCSTFIFVPLPVMQKRRPVLQTTPLTC